MLNKKGASFIDLFVAMALLIAMLTMMFQFQSYLKRYEDRQDDSMVVLLLLNNESKRAYRTDSWETLTGNTFEVPSGIATSTFSNYALTENHTDYLLLTVSLNNVQEEVAIERSVFWNVP